MIAGDRHAVTTGNIWACHRGDLTGVKAALARGVDVNLRNTVGWTACHAAAAAGHSRVLRLLHRHGADITLTDRGGNEPVHTAAQNGQFKALKALVELGADAARVRAPMARGQAVRELVLKAKRAATANDASSADRAMLMMTRQ